MSNETKEDKKYELNHEYDGIREYNYPAPKWWQIIFFGSIVWGVGYFYYYSVFNGETLRHKLDQDLVNIEIEKSKVPSTEPSENDFMAVISNPNAVKSGKEVFESKCESCHGERGQGIIGPNLTDRFWLHGKGSAVDIFRSVSKGVPEKGMPPWGPILSATQLNHVVAYVKTLQGMNPPNPKAPQGVEVKP